MMKRNFMQPIAALALIALLPAAHAAPRWYFTYGAGIARSNIDADARVNNNSGASSPYDMDIYSSSRSNNAALLFEFGKRWEISNTGLHALSLGLQYQYFLPADIGKEVMQYSAPNYLNYSYSLDLEANILLLNAKFEVFSWKKLSPFVNLGAGLLQLVATNYSENAYAGVTARDTPNFQRNANYRFTYQVGAGINWEMTQTLFASINYIYHPLTRFASKGGEGTWSNDKLDYGQINAQSVFVTINYLWGS